MNIKKFAIVSCCFVLLILATIITLGCVKVNSKLDIDEPTTFVYYVKSSVGVKKSSDEPKIYNNLKKYVNEMTDLSIFDYMVKGISLKAKSGQDYNNKYKYSYDLKEKGICLEMQFDKTQSIVVEIDGNTKVIEFTGLIMQVKDSSKAQEVALFFSTSTGESKTYKEDNPILIIAKQNKLYDYISSLVSSDDK